MKRILTLYWISADRQASLDMGAVPVDATRHVKDAKMLNARMELLEQCSDDADARAFVGSGTWEWFPDTDCALYSRRYRAKRRAAGMPVARGSDKRKAKPAAPPRPSRKPEHLIRKWVRL